jgi:hypothetical protein
MTWIKICGITNLDDALAAAEAGANALGFVFYPKSSRYVTLETARSIVAKVPQQIEKVGVFVNETVDHVRDTAKQVGLTALQLHGEESTEFSRTLFQKLSNGSGRPTIFRSYPAKIFDAPAEQPVGWDPVAVGLVEPPMHVSRSEFSESVRKAKAAGLVSVESPRIFLGRTTVLKKA